MWLVEELKPDFRTISDFRKEYVKCCRELDMLESMIKPIKNIEPNLDVEAFKDNVDILKINEDDEVFVWESNSGNQVTWYIHYQLC